MSHIENLTKIVTEIKKLKEKIHYLEKQKLEIIQEFFFKNKSKIIKYTPFKNKSDMLVTKNDITGEYDNINDYDISSETSDSE